MSTGDVVLAVLVALVAGFLGGARWSTYVFGSPGAADDDERDVRSAKMPPEQPAGRPGLREELLPTARAIADAARGDEDDGRAPASSDVVAAAIAQLAGDAYSQGVTEFRAALCARSGLPAELVDQACDFALSGIEEAHGGPAS